jgi:hypothetical protein
MQHTSASRAFTHDGSRGLISLTEEPARCLADARSYVIKTLEASESERERWNEYVRVHREATFFHRAEWGEVLARAFGHRGRYLYAESGGRIAGVLPLVEVKSLLFGHALVSTPFCVYRLHRDAESQATEPRLADEGPLRYLSAADRS